MDQTAARFSPQTLRQPLTDATMRYNNCVTPVSERHPRIDEYEEMRSPDAMSIVNSPLSPKGNMDMNCLTPVRDSGTGSKRNSTMSTVSYMSGKGKRKTHVGPWQLGRTLGQGATGRVRLAKHAVTGQTAAIKIVSKRSAAMVQSESIAAMDRSANYFTGMGTRQMPGGIEREVVIMKLIEHPNVISLYDVWENRGELYLVLEYVEGGELFDYVSRTGGLQEEEAVRLFRQIIAGLGYCHRFSICHRDLKPENILLDHRKNVKLADFGMAALQPTGHWLNTSCGSPHYAAPEIIRGKKYQGDRADIWSCGIILFALLTGYLPFDGQDVPTTLQLVKEGRFSIPPDVSDEAADLIHRILRRKPEDRISMQSIWRHPLLLKYAPLHEALIDYYVGPSPPMSADDCGPAILNRQQIDIDILRNLQTLWHDVKPDILVGKLITTEPTQERMFYNALVKFRDEQLENYQGQQLEYSASDYHHISRPQGRMTKKRNFKNRTQTSSLRHSLLMKESSRRPASIKEPMSSGTVESYDPFRSPRHHVAEDEVQCAQVTIHREETFNSVRQSVAEAGRPSEPAVKEDSDEEMEDCPPSSPFALVPEKRSKATSMKSFHSKMSQTSSRRPVLHVHTPRSTSYKRNVSFHHIRNRSQGSASAKTRAIPPKNPARRQPSESSMKMLVESSPLVTRHGSPALPAQPTVVRGSGVAVKPCNQIKKVRETEITWKEDTRQVSQELSQMCEQAFNGGSLSTECTTSTCTGSETPPTSVSIASPDASQNQIASKKYVGRDLSNARTASPRTQSMVDVAETRRKLIEHYSTKEGPDRIPECLPGVINHLDRLIDEDKSKQGEQSDVNEKEESFDDRVQSLPDPFKSSDPNSLSIISEELVSPYGSGKDISAKQLEQRAASHSNAGSNNRDKTTIRMVPQDSLRSMQPKPLTIRKKHQNTSTGTDSAAHQILSRSDTAGSDTSSRYFSGSSRMTRAPCELDPIEEIPKSPKRSGTRSSDKKWSWFRHRSQIPVDSPPKQTREVKSIHPSTATVIVHEIDPESRLSIEQQTGFVNRKPSLDKPKSSFLKKLLKRKPRKSVPQGPTAHEFTDTNPLLRDEVLTNDIPSDVSETEKQKPLPPRPRHAGKNHNWFARVFQFKPATRVIALSTSKENGRNIAFKILRNSKHLGIENVAKKHNLIYGKVGQQNFLNIKPVDFSAEFSTIIERGRRENLCVVRFRQERGAASSFHRVVDILSMAMKKEGILIEDTARAQKMAEVIENIARHSPDRS